MTKGSWFDVSRKGLLKLLDRRGRHYAIAELISNCLDADAKKISVVCEPIPGVPKARLSVTDDSPEGFKNLRHAFTLFDESLRAGEAEKRGRFNLGEKLALALCEEALIESTTGTVRFDDTGRHEHPRQTRDKGTRFEATVLLTREQVAKAIALIKSFIPPPGVEIQLCGNDTAGYENGKLWSTIRRPNETYKIERTLPTELADEMGNFTRDSKRKTIIEIFPAKDGPGMLYELGVPVVELGGGERWHVNVLQKVPLNMERDNVTPAYLREIRTLLMNTVYHELKEDDANQPWTRTATIDPKIDDAATEKMLDLRFGKDRAIYDPSDTEATKRLQAEGYTIITGSMLKAEEWENVKRCNAALPAGQISPTPKPFHPDGRTLTWLPESEWTPGIRQVVVFARELGPYLLNKGVLVHVAKDPGWNFNGTFSPDGELIMNVPKLGRKFFEAGISEDVLRFLIHEFAHDICGDHLDAEYHKALERMGARTARFALDHPEAFNRQIG